MNPNNSADDTTSREIKISRVFHAPRELVWQAMTDPAHVVHWWGPRGFTTTTKVMDVRPGGIWQHTMHGPDGTNYPNKSIFKEVVRPERIVYSHGGGKEDGPGVNFVATWTFEEIDPTHTRLTVHQVFPSSEMRERVVRDFGAIEGGRQTLARLAEYLPEMSAPGTSAVTVVARHFGAPVSTIFDAWLDPTVAGRWLFATKDGKMARVEIDARVGGHFVIAEERADGLVEHLGTYEVLDRPRKLVFTFTVPKYSALSTRVTVDFAANGDGTDLTLTHEGVPPEFAPRNRHGWETLLGQLAGVVGTN